MIFRASTTSRARMPTLTELNLYPIKSCGGISLREATLTPAGLMHEHIYDREWMVVDENSSFISQRSYPKMALISPRIKSETMELRAPGMLHLEIPLDLSDPETAPTLEVEVWGTKVKAYDCDETTAAWFSNAIGTPCRLVRFHPHAKRVANQKWTGDVEAPTLFSDGFPVLVVSQASLDDLNEKLKAQGRATLPMNRFRPNIVVDGIGAFEEDYAASLDFGDCVLKPVKPCARCTIPSVDQVTADVGPDPLDILRTYRADPKVDGGITFGMNAIVVKGEQQLLRVGQEVDVELAF
jgi:uncharacterized protein